jgi:hypothetical protein
MFAKVAVAVTFCSSASLASANLDQSQIGFGIGAMPPDLFN